MANTTNSNPNYKLNLKVRVEEATALVRDNAQLKCLLGFDDLKRLAPLQPHGVLSTTEAFENSPKVPHRLYLSDPQLVPHAFIGRCPLSSRLSAMTFPCRERRSLKGW